MPEPLFEFFLPMKSPPTHTAQQGSRTTKSGGHYRDTELDQIKHQFMVLLQPHKPEKPLPKAPYRIITKWLYPHLKNTKDGDWKLSKPDCDNMAKAFYDCIEKSGFLLNDAHFASVTTEKNHNSVTGIYVRIEAL